MSKWCGTCHRNEYIGCDKTCSVFGKDFDELAAIAIKYEVLKSKIKYLKDCAETIENNQDSIFSDERNMAESETRYVIDTLLSLEL